MDKTLGGYCTDKLCPYYDINMDQCCSYGEDGSRCIKDNLKTSQGKGPIPEDKIREEFETQALNMGHSIIKIDDQYIESLTIILHTGFLMGRESRDEEIKSLLESKRVNEESMEWAVKYNYSLISIVEEIIRLVDVDYLDPNFRDRAKKVLLGKGIAHKYRDEEIKKLRDALEQKNKLLDNGRDYLMQVLPEDITVEDSLEVFGFGRDGLQKDGE